MGCHGAGEADVIVHRHGQAGAAAFILFTGLQGIALIRPVPGTLRVQTVADAHILPALTGLPEPGAVHAQRLKDVLPQIVREPLPADNLDQRAQHIVGQPVQPVRPRLKLQGLLSNGTHQLPGGDALAVLFHGPEDLRAAQVIVDAGGHAEQVLNQHRLRCLA